MEKRNSIAVEAGVGPVVAVGDGRVAETEKEEMTIAGGSREKKDTIAIENKGASKKKIRKMMKKKKAKETKKVLASTKVVSGGKSAADDETTEAVVVSTSEGGVRGCRIQVSSTKKPLFLYVNLAKRYIKQNNYVQLSALGMAIPTVVTIAEILKKDGWARERDITISSVPLKDDAKGRVVMKAKIDIVLEKTKKLEKDGLVAAKDPSEINEDETKEFSSETNGNLFEKKDQFDANGTLTEKNELQNVILKLIERGRNSQARLQI